ISDQFNLLTHALTKWIFSSSVYEISGSEVCFSTGDLIKVIALDLQSVCCEDASLFKVVPDQMPYSTVDEMMKLRPIGLESCLPFTFSSRTKITIGDFTLGPRRELTVKSTERLEDGEEYIRCFIRGQQETSAEVCIPLSTKGEFYECENEECFSLKEIMSNPNLRSRKYHFANTTKPQQPLLLSPLYQVHAIMSLRKNVLKFPSSLEVDVIDVTDTCNADFVTPLSLTEILSQPDEHFPAVLEILEGPGSRAMFKCNWLPGLKAQNKIIFHKKGSSAMVLISNLKNRKMQQHFLVSQQYGGRFKRRQREFGSVYEVYAASVNAPGLKVSVTRNCEEIDEDGIPALNVGEQLEIVRCERIELPNAKEDQEKQKVNKEIYLPMYMQCHFMEVLADNKKYKLKDLGKEFSLPLDVKVVTKDSELDNDPLATLNIRIEAALVEPVIQASFLSSPGQWFVIPPKWLSMSVYFTKECVPWPNDQPPKYQMETVTEVTDEFLYEFRKQASANDEAPPPRPPKRNMSCEKSIKKSKTSKKNKCKIQAESVPSKEFNDLTLNCKKRPPVFCNAFPYFKTIWATYKFYNSILFSSAPVNTTDEESDHDYESVDDFSTVIKNAQENALFL
uniref:Thymocyte selection associated family member 2 n=1 Tax=Neogobius melanostomus TaxID=47308 RepID=A0A8C6TFM7_9GOBI